MRQIQTIVDAFPGDLEFAYLMDFTAHTNNLFLSCFRGFPNLDFLADYR
jgi:hypothetical protein